MSDGRWRAEKSPVALRSAIVLAIAAGVLALALWRALADRRALRDELDRVYVNEVTIQGVDATTNAPLHITLHGPSIRAGQRWPKLTTIATGDPSELQVRWADVAPIEMNVSAEGYHLEPVRLDENSGWKKVVPLRRLVPATLPTTGPI